MNLLEKNILGTRENQVVWEQNVKLENMTKKQLIAAINELNTEQKLIPNIAGKSKDVIETILNIFPDPVIVTNTKGKIIYCNEVFVQTISFEKEEMTKESIFDFFNPDSANKLQNKTNKVLQSNSPLDFEYKQKGKILKITIYPVFDDGKKIKQFVYFIRDITEIRLIELSESEKTLQMEHLLETAKHLISSLDTKEVINRIAKEAKELLNSYGCAIYTLEKDEKTLTPMVSLDPVYTEEILSTSIPVEGSFTGKVIKAKKCLIFNDTRSDSGGFQIPGTTVLENERIIGAPFVIDNKAIGAMILNRIGKMFTKDDLSLVETLATYATSALKNAKLYNNLKQQVGKRKKAEKHLAGHEEHLKLINKILRHDITNNLAVIKSAIRIFKETKDTALLDEASQCVTKSAELIRRMKELEFFISSDQRLLILDLREIISDVIENYKTIDFKIIGDSKVLADETLSSVFDNIIRNSALHGKADKIEIEIIKKNEITVIKLKDNGVHIPDEIKEKIFEESFKYGKYGQSGLGLFIVKKAIEGYKGNVFVEDNKPRGTVIVLELKRIE